MRSSSSDPPGRARGRRPGSCSERLDIPQISTGDILREHVQEGTPARHRGARPTWTRASCVPDDVVVRMVVERLGEPDAPRGSSWTGSRAPSARPRRWRRARRAGRRRLTAVLKFTISDAMAIRRIAGRRTCPICKRTYHRS